MGAFERMLNEPSMPVTLKVPEPMVVREGMIASSWKLATAAASGSDPSTKLLTANTMDAGEELVEAALVVL